MKYASEERVQELIDETKRRLDTKVDKSTAPYRAGGSYSFATLPEPSESTLGLVYNVTDDFETTEDFIEGAGLKAPAGTDVAVVSNGEDPVEYKYNIYGGAVSDTVEAMTSEELAEMWKDAGTLTLDKNSVTLSSAGATDAVTATAASGAVSATTADEGIATVTVDSTGDHPVATITAVAAGETIVTITSGPTTGTRAVSSSVTVTCTF